MASIEETRERYEQGEGGYFRPSINREIDAYSLLESLKRSKVRPALRYRCKNDRDMLAEVYQLRQGILIRQPSYLLSDEVNLASSNVAGRTKNTLNGDNQWEAQVYFLDQGYPNLQCAHLRDYRLDPEQIKKDLAQRKRVVAL